MFERDSDHTGINAALLGPVDPALRLLRETRDAIARARTDHEAIVDTLCGANLEAQTLAPLRVDFGAKIFAHIDAYERSVAQSKAAAKAAGAALQELLGLPQPLRDVALESAGKKGWMFAGAGVKSMPLETGGKLHAKLLRIEPGHGAPNHDHTGTEYTLVVAGAFHDHSGLYGPGDLSIMQAGQAHTPVAAHEGVCIALSVEQGSVAFTGALGLLQRMLTRH